MTPSVVLPRNSGASPGRRGMGIWRESSSRTSFFFGNRSDLLMHSRLVGSSAYAYISKKKKINKNPMHKLHHVWVKTIRVISSQSKSYFFWSNCSTDVILCQQNQNEIKIHKASLLKFNTVHSVLKYISNPIIIVRL